MSVIFVMLYLGNFLCCKHKNPQTHKIVKYPILLYLAKDLTLFCIESIFPVVRMIQMFTVVIFFLSFCLCACCFLQQAFLNPCIYYLSPGKYLMLETFVNVCS